MSVKNVERVGKWHVWTSDDAGRGYREECYPSFHATWRGEPVRFTIQANRYEHSSGISEWRVYCQDAREGRYAFDREDGTREDGYRGRELTDTARARLREAAEPIVREWLASEEYRREHKRALASMVVREIMERYGHARTVLNRYREQMDPADVAAIERLLSLREEFYSAVEAFKPL